MANSQSESSVSPPLKVRWARSRLRRGCSMKSAGVMKLDQGFAEGTKRMPSPGINVVLCAVRGFSQQNVVRGFSLVSEGTTLKGRTTDF
jgi:hypothetical protein